MSKRSLNYKKLFSKKIYTQMNLIRLRMTFSSQASKEKKKILTKLKKSKRLLENCKMNKLNLKVKYKNHKN